MNQHRTGDAFPNPQAPGDPRTLREINNRTPWIAGGAGEQHHVPGRTIITPPVAKRGKYIKPPFWPTLRGSASAGRTLDMIPGNVILRRDQYGIDAVVTILPTDIPSGLSVVDGDKFTCKILETDTGIFAVAAIIKTNGAWPTSSAPGLKGGDNASGTAGERHIRLCEVLETDGKTSVVVHNTGHVDHFQPSLVNNSINTAYTVGEGTRLLRYFHAATGTWQMREPVKGLGQLTITEDGALAEFRGNKQNTRIRVYVGEGTADDIPFADGLITRGADVVGDEDPAVAAEDIDINIPTVVAKDASVTVTEKAGVGDRVVYEIAATGGLPSGSAGETLYHNGTAWIVVPAPTTAASSTKINIFTHTGPLGVPSWQTKDIKAISVCDGGSPTTWDIIKL